MPPFRVDGKFKLFKFKNDKTGICSLSIKCNEENERFFEQLCEVVAKESCRLVPKVNGRKLTLSGPGLFSRSPGPGGLRGPDAKNQD